MKRLILWSSASGNRGRVVAKHLWEVDHSYYCTDGQYFSSQDKCQTVWEFKSWADFLSEMGDADMDYNLLFRWDWKEVDPETGKPSFSGDVNYRNGVLKMYFMAQRKGFHSCSIVQVCRADEAAVIEYLRPRLAHLLEMWEPVARTEPEGWNNG